MAAFTVEVYRVHCGCVNHSHPEIVYSGNDFQAASDAYDRAIAINSGCLVKFLTGGMIYHSANVG